MAFPASVRASGLDDDQREDERRFHFGGCARVNSRSEAGPYLKLLSDAPVQCWAQCPQAFLRACVQTTNRAQEEEQMGARDSRDGGGVLKDIRVDTWTNERREMKRVMRHVEIMMKGVAEAEM